MRKVGITGGIGSGKTTVANIFKLLGVPVYNSDDRAKELMRHDPEIRAAIIAAFGDQAYDPDGSLNRAFLAEAVFENPTQLQELNAIVHPAVGEDFMTWCAQHPDSPYVLKEAALIFEAGIHTSLDDVIMVWAPEAVRVARVLQRDDTTEEAVHARMRNQWPDNVKIPLADFLIVNDGSHGLIRQVIDIHQLMKAMPAEV